jgi:hypothetical protein
VFGICFGAQLICAALGGRVEAMGTKEIGWFAVSSDDEAAVPAGPWLEFHGDRCLPPAGATVLARNDLAVQAFRVGRHFAVQFHPEVDGPQLKRWLDSMGTAELDSIGLDPDQFLADTIREEPAAKARAAHLVTAALAQASQLVAAPSDRVAGGFGGVAPPGGRRPPEGPVGELVYFPLRVLLEPMIMPALRTGIT